VVGAYEGGEALAGDWEQLHDEQGRAYYHSKLLGKTSWDPPAADAGTSREGALEEAHKNVKGEEEAHGEVLEETVVVVVVEEEAALGIHRGFLVEQLRMETSRDIATLAHLSASHDSASSSQPQPPCCEAPPPFSCDGFNFVDLFAPQQRQGGGRGGLEMKTPSVPCSLTGAFHVSIQVTGGGQEGEEVDATVMFLCNRLVHGGGRERACGDVCVGAGGVDRIVKIPEKAFGMGGGLVALVLVRGSEGEAGYASKVKGTGVVMRSRILGDSNVHRRTSSKVATLPCVHGVFNVAEITNFE
jgi:hypothetical protein